MALRYKPRLSIRSFIVVLVLSAILPGLFAGGLIIVEFSRAEMRVTREQLTGTVHALSVAVDREIESIADELAILARSGEIRSGNLAAVYRRASEVLDGRIGWIALLDPSGRQIFNTRRPFGTTFSAPEDISTVRRVVETRRPAVSGVITSSFSASPVVAIAVPVIHNDEVQYVLEYITTAERVGLILEQSNLPAGWISFIVDSDRNFIARYPSPKATVIPEAQLDLAGRTMKGGETSTFDTSLEGLLLTGALATSNFSGWAVGLEVPKDILDAPFHRSLVELLGIGAVLALAGALLAQRIGRRIDRSIASLLRAAESLNCDLQPIIRAAGIREIEQIGTALADAGELLKERSAERDAALERLRLAVTAGRMGVFDWDLRTGTFLWGDECYRMLGYQIGEVEPSQAVWMARIHPDDREAAEAAETRARREHNEFINEYRIIRRDGSVRWVLARGRFLYDADKPLRMIGLKQDITETRQQIETQRVLVAELQHRTRNLMAVVQSIAHQTLNTADSLADFKERFNNRLEALSRVQSLLSRADNEPITLGELVLMELQALGSHAIADRITFGGPDAPLRKSAVEMLTLAIHELLTNAIKYGALASETGHLSVTWRIEGTPPDRRLVLGWIERGIASPHAADMKRSGYGRTLIEEALPYSLSAETKFELDANTLRCLISLPLATKDVDEMVG